MKYLNLTSTDPHFNMAFDQYCLESGPAGECFFYLWRNRPSVIIGRNQSAYAEVNLPYLEKEGILLARRVTGGGAVYHDLENLNYSIVGPAKLLERLSPQPVEWIAQALRRLGVPAEVSGRNDILVEGRKCSGYAKRLWKDRMMVHGTLMFNIDLERLSASLSVRGSKFSSGIASVRSRVANLKSYLPEGTTVTLFQADLQRILADGDPEIGLTDASEAEIDQIAVEKFRSPVWIYGQSPKTELVRQKKFACGTIRADYTLQRGKIAEIHFSGDFIGNLPVEELESALTDCCYDEDALNESVPKCIAEFFDGMDREEFVSFILGK